MSEASDLRHVIFMPVKYHPEFLYLSLEALSRCRGIENYRLYFAIGKNYDPGVLEVIDQFNLPHMKHFSEKVGMEDDMGEGMKAVANMSKDYFLCVAGDEVVSYDYFETMEYIVSHFHNERLFSISTTGVHLNRQEQPEDIELITSSEKPCSKSVIKPYYGYGPNCFHTCGVLIFTEPFKRYCQSYLTDEYYNCLRLLGLNSNYIPEFFVKNFPDWEYGYNVWGIDGLLDRIMKKFKLYSLVTIVPRCHEVGFLGAHKETEDCLAGLPLTIKITWIKLQIAQGKLKKRFKGIAYDYFDMEDNHQWKELRLV